MKLKKIYYSCQKDPLNCKLSAFLLFKKDTTEIEFYVQKGGHNHQEITKANPVFKPTQMEPLVKHNVEDRENSS